MTNRVYRLIVATQSGLILLLLLFVLNADSLLEKIRDARQQDVVTIN